MTATHTSFLQSQRYTERVVDRIGSGDSFAAGLIHGVVSGRDLDATRQCAVAVAAGCICLGEQGVVS